MHLRFDKLSRKSQAKVAEMVVRQQIGAEGQRLLVAADDFPILDRPQVLVPVPAVERLAVEQVDFLRVARFGRHDDLISLILFGGHALERTEQGQHGD
jgi:hypothetical protein